MRHSIGIQLLRFHWSSIIVSTPFTKSPTSDSLIVRLFSVIRVYQHSICEENRHVGIENSHVLRDTLIFAEFFSILFSFDYCMKMWEGSSPSPGHSFKLDVLYSADLRKLEARPFPSPENSASPSQQCHREFSPCYGKSCCLQEPWSIELQ